MDPILSLVSELAPEALADVEAALKAHTTTQAPPSTPAPAQALPDMVALVAGSVLRRLKRHRALLGCSCQTLAQAKACRLAKP